MRRIKNIIGNTFFYSFVGLAVFFLTPLWFVALVLGYMICPDFVEWLIIGGVQLIFNSIPWIIILSPLLALFGLFS